MLVNEELKATGKFEMMDLRVDEAEHSMEMHLPYLVKVFQGYYFLITNFIFFFAVFARSLFFLEKNYTHIHGYICVYIYVYIGLLIC